MFIFKLLSGTYRRQDGKKYLKGDIVESTRDLRVVFVNKFELVEIRKDLPIQVTVGSDVVSPSSFTGGEVAKVINTSPPDKISSKTEDTADTSVKEEDVTDGFPRAVNIGGLKVVKLTNSTGESTYNIIDVGNGQLHNKNPLQSELKVKKFLKNMSEEEDTE
jgi:hypothetical protein